MLKKTSVFQKPLKNSIIYWKNMRTNGFYFKKYNHLWKSYNIDLEILFSTLCGYILLYTIYNFCLNLIVNVRFYVFCTTECIRWIKTWKAPVKTVKCKSQYCHSRFYASKYIIIFIDGPPPNLLTILEETSLMRMKKSKSQNNSIK